MQHALEGNGSLEAQRTLYIALSLSLTVGRRKRMRKDPGGRITITEYSRRSATGNRV